jgi:hypothetical protein
MPATVDEATGTAAGMLVITVGGLRGGESSLLFRADGAVTAPKPMRGDRPSPAMPRSAAHAGRDGAAYELARRCSAPPHGG